MFRELFKLIIFWNCVISSVPNPINDPGERIPEDGNFDISENSSEIKFIKTVEDYIVNFMLYNRNHEDKFYLLQIKNPLSFKRSDLDSEKDTKIIIHGWHNGYESNFSVVMKDAYLKRYDANVILVDWSPQSRLNYVSSRMDVSKVAEVVAQFVDILVTDYGIKSSKVHIIGHSLGAHISGIAGLNLKTGNVSRITGLDPALPMFTVYESGRLRADSADFVDVIHTCGNLLGFKTPLGQVDFYPNGGTFEQPGCGFDYKGKCSHSRSYLYFAESITATKPEFLAVSCPDWDAFDLDEEGECSLPVVPMGEFTPRNARGLYYLKTNSEAPWARGLKDISV